MDIIDLLFLVFNTFEFTFSACFQHDMAYGKYKGLTKITKSDKVLRDKVFEIASNPKYDGCSFNDFYVFDKKSA